MTLKEAIMFDEQRTDPRLLEANKKNECAKITTIFRDGCFITRYRFNLNTYIILGKVIREDLSDMYSRDIMNYIMCCNTVNQMISYLITNAETHHYYQHNN